MSHGANGMQDGHSVKYTFDIPYTKSGADKIIVGNNSDLNFLHNGTTDYTIEFDFNATDLTGTGKNTVRLKVPYNYFELDDFESKSLDLLGIQENWLTDICLDNSHCSHF